MDVRLEIIACLEYKTDEKHCENPAKNRYSFYICIIVMKNVKRILPFTMPVFLCAGLFGCSDNVKIRYGDWRRFFANVIFGFAEAVKGASL